MTQVEQGAENPPVLAYAQQDPEGSSLLRRLLWLVFAVQVVEITQAVLWYWFWIPRWSLARSIFNSPIIQANAVIDDAVLPPLRLAFVCFVFWLLVRRRGPGLRLDWVFWIFLGGIALRAAAAGANVFSSFGGVLQAFSSALSDLVSSGYAVLASMILFRATRPGIPAPTRALRWSTGTAIAFGMFYTTIWIGLDPLSPWRSLPAAIHGSLAGGPRPLVSALLGITLECSFLALLFAALYCAMARRRFWRFLVLYFFIYAGALGVQAATTLASAARTSTLAPGAQSEWYIAVSLAGALVRHAGFALALWWVVGAFERRKASSSGRQVVGADS